MFVMGTPLGSQPMGMELGRKQEGERPMEEEVAEEFEDGGMLLLLVLGLAVPVVEEG